MINCVSFSLWGDHPMYWVGAIRNIELVDKLLPGWKCRFYIDDRCRPDLIESIKKEPVETVMVKSTDAFHGMFWRFSAANDPGVNIALSRDCDSRIGPREISAINEWLDSDKDFHIMRDHPYHGTEILGGMWGCRNGLLRKIGIDSLIDQWKDRANKGIDQTFLAHKVYPLIKDTAFEHSDFGLRYANDTHPFPTPRTNYEFVGEIYDQDNNRSDHWKIIKQITG